MSNSQSSKNSKLNIDPNKQQLKSTLISKCLNSVSTLEKINFRFDSIFSAQISETSKEAEKISSNRQDLESKISSINLQISSLDEDRNHFFLESSDNKQKLEKELSSLQQQKTSEISSIKDEISYKTDLVTFYERLSSIHITDLNETLGIEIRSLSDEFAFNLARNDADSTFSYNLTRTSKPLDQLPEWLKSDIVFQQSLSSLLFSNIYDILFSVDL